MKVIQIRTEGNHIRYYLADEEGFPVESVMKFLKFKDNTGYARNTLRMYCIHLKQYFMYLQDRKKDYAEVNLTIWRDLSPGFRILIFIRRWYRYY